MSHSQSPSKVTSAVGNSGYSLTFYEAINVGLK